MKIISFISTGFLSVFGVLSPILDWIFKDKSIYELNVENSISEVENQYKEALKSIRNGEKDQVDIKLKNGDILEVKSMK